VNEMKLGAALVSFALAVGVAAAPGAASRADDATKRACTTINLGGPKVFTKHNMRCKKAKRYARRLYKTRGDDKPPNFRCSSGSNFRDGGFCKHKTKDKNFGWHPAD
jgi:hypothetical protein